MRTLITTAFLLFSTSAHAFTPSDCSVSDKRGGSRALAKYCAQLRLHAIKSAPAYELSGVIERADPIEGEPKSAHYFWIKGADETLYFDGVSDIGRRILTACKVGQRCIVKIVGEKSWEHNLDHATFWIARLDGDPKPVK